LGVSTEELLDGTELEPPAAEMELPPQETKRRRPLGLWTYHIVTAGCLLAAAVCWVCDLALNDRLTWSLTVDISLLLAWGIAAAALMGRRRGRRVLIVLSCGVPALLLGLGLLWRQPMVYLAGWPITAVVMADLWLCRWLGLRLRARKWLAVGAVIAALAVMSLMVELLTWRFFGQTPWGREVLPLLILAAACAGADLCQKC